MRYHLIVSDGGFASGLAEALGMLLGKWEDVLRVSFQDGMALPLSRSRSGRSPPLSRRRTTPWTRRRRP
jgi:hypothetical protein